VSNKKVLTFNSKIEFANFGKNSIAYVRRVNTNELTEPFHESGELMLDEDVWALYGADGEPIAIADEQSLLFDNAEERELVAVQRH